jgi:short repeat uncharacterized protein DUF308
VSNRIRHADQPAGAPVVVRAAVVDGVVRVEVHDQGNGRAHRRTPDAPEGGFGLHLGVAGFFSALFELREDRAARMLVAVVDLVLGVLILSLPDLSLRTVAILAGIGFIVRGVSGLHAGWQLRKAGTPPGRVAPAA